MWYISNIIIKNLGSIKEIDLAFTIGKVRNIIGENNFDESQKSNGSGKSLAAEGIYIALVGETIRGESVYGMITDGKDLLELTLNLLNPINNSTLKINRKFYKSAKKHEVKLTLNEEPDIQSAIEEYTKRILNLVEISKEDLINYFIINTDRFKPLFLSSDTEIKQTISRFSGSYLLKGIDKLINNDLKIENDKIIEIQNKISNLNHGIVIYNNQIKELQDIDLEKERNENILSFKNIICEKNKEVNNWNESKYFINNKINEIKNTILLEEEKLNIFEKQLIELKKPETLLEIEKLNSEEEQYILIKNNINNYLEKKDISLRELNYQLSTYKNKLQGIISCAKCEHKFSLQDKNFDFDKVTNILLANLEKELIEINKDINENISNKKIIQDEINNLDIAKDKLRKLEEKYKNDNLKYSSDIKKIKNNIENYKDEISIQNKQFENRNILINDLIKTIEIYDIKLKEEQERELKPKEYKDIQAKINLANRVINELNIDKDKILIEISKITEWSTLFKRFETYLSNKSIKNIEGYTNYYLTNMKTDLAVFIEGEKLLGYGKSIREEIDISILRDGIKKGNFKRYSGGEKGKLIVANILAMKALINGNAKNGGGIDYCNLDEVIDKMDSVGINSLFKALKNINETIDIVTHANNDVINVDKITFIKQSNGETILL